jgi:hypothetical protein
MTTSSAQDSDDVVVPILSKERDPRLITIRRGGTLTDEDHRLLAEWAVRCAKHVLHLFEQHQPGDSRPRDAIALDTSSRRLSRGQSNSIRLTPPNTSWSS